MRFAHSLAVVLLLIGLLFLASYFIAASALGEIGSQGHAAVIEKEILRSSFAYLGLVSPSLFFINALSVEAMAVFFLDFSAFFMLAGLFIAFLTLLSERRMKPIFSMLNYSSWVAGGIMLFYGILVKLVFGPSAISGAERVYHASLNLLVENAFRIYVAFGASLLLFAFLVTAYLRSTQRRGYELKPRSLREIGRKFDF